MRSFRSSSSEPEFQGQNKGRLMTQEAARLVDAHVARRLRPLARRCARHRPRKLLDWTIERAEERLRRRAEKDVARKTGTCASCSLPGKLADCSQYVGAGVRTISSSRAIPPAARRNRRVTGRARPMLAAARQNSQCRQRDARQGRRQPATLADLDAGARHRHRPRITKPRRFALRQSHRDDGCRCRRRPISPRFSSPSSIGKC